MRVKYFLLIQFIFVLFWGCSKESDYKVKILKKRNPTDFVFSLPKDSLASVVLKIFKEFRYTNSPVYSSSVLNFYHDGHRTPVSFVAESFAEHVFSKRYFETTGAKDDIYLYNLVGAWPSPIYYSNGQPLLYRTSFVITLTSKESNKTLLTVKAESPVILKGTECCGPHGSYSKEIPVPPTTIEEYTIILLIAEELGVEIPPMKLEFEE
jgi:hypothetical protein